MLIVPLRIDSDESRLLFSVSDGSCLGCCGHHMSVLVMEVMTAPLIRSLLTESSMLPSILLPG